MWDSKRDTDVTYRLLESVGEGEGGMIWENGIETCILSCKEFLKWVLKWWSLQWNVFFFLFCIHSDYWHCNLVPFIIWGKDFFPFILEFHFPYAYSSHFVFCASYSLSVLSTSLPMICQQSYLYLTFDSLIFSAVSNLLLSSFIWFFIVFSFLLILQFPFVLLFKISVSYENLPSCLLSLWVLEA